MIASSGFPPTPSPLSTSTSFAEVSNHRNRATHLVLATPNLRSYAQDPSRLQKLLRAFIPGAGVMTTLRELFRPVNLTQSSPASQSHPIRETTIHTSNTIFPSLASLNSKHSSRSKRKKASEVPSGDISLRIHLEASKKLFKLGFREFRSGTPNGYRLIWKEVRTLDAQRCIQLRGFQHIASRQKTLLIEGPLFRACSL